MKILQIYKDYYPPVKGGIEKHINLLSNSLKKRGFETEVLVSNTRAKTERIDVDGIQVTKVAQGGRLSSAPLNITFPVWLRKLGINADILHFHFPNPTAEISYLFSGMERNVVVTYHSDIVRQKILGKLYEPFMFKFLKKVRIIITTSLNYMNSSNILNKFRYKCKVIPFGIEMTKFLYRPDATPTIDTLRQTHGSTILLFIGRFRYYKGLHVLIDAMKTIEEGKLLLIGSGPLEQDLKRRVAKADLNHKVFFLGELPDQEMVQYLQACDIFIFPSIYRSEAFGIVQLEAMACGKPIISTELGTGTSFVNKHQQTGLVIPPDDVEALSKAIKHLAANPDLREKYGEASRERVKENFSAEKMVDKVIAVYKDCTS